MTRSLLILAAALLPCVSYAGSQLSSPQESGYGKDMKDVKIPAPEECPRRIFPESPVGLLTVGGRFSEHQTGVFIDTITPLFASCDRTSFLFYDSGTSYEDIGQTTSQNGLGYRQLFPAQEIIIGANVFYDNIDSYRGNQYSQLGFGAEILTHWVDARFNYFLPDDNSFEFDRNNGFKSYESMREGYNAEVGFLIPGLTKFGEYRVYGGYFHYDNRFGQDYEGFKARLEARILAGVIADVEYLDDTAINSSTWTAGVRVSVPFSAFRILSGRNPFEGFTDAFKPRERGFSERMSEMIVRSPARIVTSTGDRR